MGNPASEDYFLFSTNEMWLSFVRNVFLPLRVNKSGRVYNMRWYYFLMRVSWKRKTNLSFLGFCAPALWIGFWRKKSLLGINMISRLCIMLLCMIYFIDITGINNLSNYTKVWIYKLLLGEIYIICVLYFGACFSQHWRMIIEDK